MLHDDDDDVYPADVGADGLDTASSSTGSNDAERSASDGFCNG